MIFTTCQHCQTEIVRYRGWIVSAVNTLVKRTKTKERCFVLLGERVIPVDPGLYLDEGRTIYKTHECGGTNASI